MAMDSWGVVHLAYFLYVCSTPKLSLSPAQCRTHPKALVLCPQSIYTLSLFLAALHHISDTMRHDRRQSGSYNQLQDSLHDVPPSPSSCSDSSVDEDEMNCRMKPFWPKYQATFKRRGFQLDTLKDVKLFYNQRSQDTPSNFFVFQEDFHQDTTQEDDDSLCPDAGLVCASSHGLILTSLSATPSLTIYSEAHEFLMRRESW